MPKAPIMLQSGPWLPATTSLQIDAKHCVELVSRSSLEEWPVLSVRPGSCLAQPMADGTALQLRVIDQGKSFNRPGQFGRGVSITVPSGIHATTWKGKPAATAKARLLPFVVVARVTASESTPKARRDAQTAAIKACCERLGYTLDDDGEPNRLSAWVDRSVIMIYDTERSAGWLVNHATGRQPSNVTIAISHAPAHRWLLHWRASAPLKIGDHLFGKYGVGSDIGEDVRVADEARAARSPIVNARKRALGNRMAALRAAKAQKRESLSTPSGSSAIVSHA
jgi:hypothetical protein